ncbi:hypothetical protein AGENTSMITH_194 [Bacillus phage vB_BspM_AgentSmith]|nr:hypothetical protein AGENTSMITH_194 [Bacillus phage vB_BspM_AgentSmith]
MLDLKTIVDNYTREENIVPVEVLPLLFDAHSEEEQLVEIEKDHKAITKISNREEHFLMKVVNANPWCVGEILNPSEYVALEAISVNPLAIAVIDEPSLRVCKYALGKDPKVAIYIPGEYYDQLGLSEKCQPKPFFHNLPS